MSKTIAKAILSWIVPVAFVLSSGSPLKAQEINLKQAAIDKFESEDYQEAISLLKQAVSENPHDAEAYYYLGYYTHHLCYDVPPRKYDEDKSNEILEYLSIAVALDPHYGNAFYFMGSEHGARFHFALKEGNLERAKKELRAGREKGGYPDWLVEYARNMLSSCDSSAILFTGGDAEVNPALYLQFVESYRTDITVVPVASLDFPPFVMVAKRGVEGYFHGIPTSWSEEQILSMRPHEWKSEIIKVPITEPALQMLPVPPQKNVMEWELKPDTMRDSLELLSPGCALIADIVKTNRWERPIYFSIGSPRNKRANLDPYLQLCGLTYRLLPIEVEEYDLNLNPQKIERVLLMPEHYSHFGTVKEFDMPRCSHLLNNYRVVLIQLASYYAKSGNNSKAADILDKMTTYMPEDAFPLFEKLQSFIENFRGSLEIERE